MKTRYPRRSARLLPAERHADELLVEITQLRRALDLRERQEQEAAIARANEHAGLESRIRALKALCADYAGREHALKTILFALRPELRRIYT